MNTTLVESKNELSQAEAERLAELELIIKRGFKIFLSVGVALLEVSDRRLYRASNDTFEQYCREKWNMTARHAYRLCNAAEVIKSLPAKCDQLVTSESQARELARLPEAERVGVIEEVIRTDGKLTAQRIRAVAEPRVSLCTGDQEWHTPAVYIESCRAVLGEIDLDPASNPEAQRTVKARHYFTKQDDGLEQPWTGRVFLNPPYSAGVIDDFVDRLLRELEAGNVSQAILLTNDNTDTKWWQKAAVKAAAVCLVSQRIKFEKPDGVYSSPTNGQSFFYFGSSLEKFVEHFKKHGVIYGSPLNS